MDQKFLQILNLMDDAAVTVEQDKLTWCSESATRLGIDLSMPLSSLLPEGIQLADLNTEQRVSLPALGQHIYVQACQLDDVWVLILHDVSMQMNRAALAQTSRQLRKPLEDILFTSRRLFERLEEQEDAGIQAQTARLNRGYYRLLRTATAFSELYQGAQKLTFAPQRVELRLWLRELSERICSVVEATGKHLDITFPSQHLYAQADLQLLEHALLCLLSNALSYSSPGSTVTLRMHEWNGMCLFTMKNPVDHPVLLSDLSGSFASDSPAETDRHGLGLGITRVQHIARQHGGVLLLEFVPSGSFVATLRIPGYRRSDDVHMPQLGIERDGGFSPLLVELSDVLPDEVFDTRNL